MLTSLFGDLGSSKDAHPKSEGEQPTFAATQLMETMATEVNDRGQMIERHQRDLVVSGSPAQAMREHFAESRADLDTASSMITMLDPSGVWASAVIKALSDAGGRPIERLHLREKATLRTLAMIERTTLVRRDEDTLRIWHADVRAPGPDNAEIPLALIERSQLTAVIVGPMQPHAIDALFQTLLHATSLPNWRCPNVLFMLPPSGGWMAERLAAVPWPSRLNVHVLKESMTGASAVWNAMLRIWDQVKSQPGWDPAAVSPMLGNDFPIKVLEIGGAAAAQPLNARSAAGTAASAAPQVTVPVASATPAARVSRNLVDPTRAKEALAGMLVLDGLLGCALVDANSGVMIAHEAREGQRIDFELAAAACTQVLRTHRQAARNMGLAEPIEEIITTSGTRQQFMRALARHSELFVVALLEKRRTNLALARLQLIEVERQLA